MLEDDESKSDAEYACKGELQEGDVRGTFEILLTGRFLLPLSLQIHDWRGGSREKMQVLKERLVQVGESVQRDGGLWPGDCPMPLNCLW